ncbi:hypothetical protein [Modestobacter sp. NPDC049651]|uniref:hypothetical protein n=1 Tax=unclassified Modestobacter TaxID=2643866 RepID=UPI00340E690D
MPTSTQRRSPRAVPAPARRPARRGPVPTTPARPLPVPFAAVFGVLTAVVDGYLGWVLVSDPDVPAGWWLVPFALLAALALLGAALTLAGRARGAAVLATAGALTLVGLVVLLVLFLAVGQAGGTWWVLALLVAPLGALVLAAQRPVRAWTHRRGRTAQ